jgi:hypothetical protein
MLKFEVIGAEKIINTKFIVDVKLVADAIKDDIKNGIIKKTDINGSKYPKNTNWTKIGKGHSNYLRKSDKLLNSIDSKKISTSVSEVFIKNSKYKSGIDTNTIAGFIQDGTKKHIIKPKIAKLLHWKDSNGNDYYAEKVKHPGTKAVKFFGISKKFYSGLDSLLSKIVTIK